MIHVPVLHRASNTHLRALFPISGILLATALPAPAAWATEYLTVEAVQQATFPQADAFAPVVIAQQTPEQLQALLAQSGPQPPHGAIRIWKASQAGTVLGYVLVDEVIGKQNLITYAIGIDNSGAVHGLEILSYRESHGAEIRNPAWRSQFDHRKGLQQLRFGVDIKNISGATLSSEHVTQGVRWLMALWQSALRSTPATG
jgi:Na+-translocating ferredoxin:NAD+ oxidoreductase RnfG subunit